MSQRLPEQSCRPWSDAGRLIPHAIAFSISVVMFLYARRAGWIAGSIALTLLVLDLFIPSAHRAATTALRRMSLLVAGAIGYVALGVVYLTIFTPAGLITRILRLDPLQLRSRRRTYWFDRNDAGDPARMYSPEMRSSEGTLPIRLVAGLLSIGAGLFLLMLADLATGSVVNRIRARHALARRAAPGEPWKEDYFREYDSGGFRFDANTLWMRSDVRGQFINIKDGVRATYRPRSAGPRPKRIFLFGGSALWGYGARDDHTIPSELARLAEGEGRNWIFVNRGQLAHVSWQNVAALSDLCAAGDIPDAVVFYNGANEVEPDCNCRKRGGRSSSSRIGATGMRLRVQRRR